jgi:putative transcriptional regulator
MNSLEGHLLIASPNMGDPRFHRAVILMLHHDEQGAMGVVLNRPIPRQAAAIASLLGETLPGPIPTTEADFHVGGPVAGPLIVLQGLPDQDGSPGPEDASPGRIFVVEKQDQLRHLIDNTDSSLQFYVGHAGWNEGQLENEVAEGAWLTLPASVDFVFGENEDMWVAAMRDVGRAFYRNVLGVRHFPDDPAAN